MKRIMLFCLLLTLAFSWTLPAHADLSQEEIYVALQEQLHDRLYGVENVLSFESLAQQFTQLGSYKKSAQYRYYTSILADTEAGYYGSLSRNFRLLRLDAAFCEQLAEEGLPTVDELEAYTQGRQAEASGDWASAVACYERSIAVLDSLVRLDALLYEHANLLQEGLVVGDYKIDTYDNGTCVIQKYTGTTADLTIPMYIGGYQVRGIGELAFGENEYLTRAVIPEGVRMIGNAAFAFSPSLTSITIPDSASIPQIIDDLLTSNPFLGCTALVDIRVSPSHPELEIVDGVLFNSVENRLICYPAGFTAESYTVPYGVKIIDPAAFSGCSLVSIVIPETVTTMWLTSDCPNLASITIPSSVYVNCGLRTFENCPNLTLRVQAGSHAHGYAQRWNIPYEIY